MITLLADEQKALSDYIYSVCSISLDESKGYLIESRLGSLVEQAGCRSYTQFLARARSDATGATKRKIIDAITTGETLFFRDTGPFDLLRHKILPELIDRRTRTGSTLPIRIWSAACSTGQELYSIAIVVKELLRGSEKFSVRLLGTDISDQAVAKASRGHFGSIEIGRGLTDEVRNKYFIPTGGEWKIRDEIRVMASFKTFNLMQDFGSLGKFDVIFCRNVAIYFNGRDKEALFGRMGQALEKDGFLVIGAMESLTGICPQFESKRHLRSVYYQLRSGARI